MSIDWTEWKNLTQEQYRKKWNRLNFKEKEHYLFEYVGIEDNIAFHGTEPGHVLRIVFWTRANNQNYLTWYIPDTDEFIFFLHGKEVDIGNRIPRIKAKLLEKIGKEYG